MQNIIEGFNKFRERIKPAVIVENGPGGEANSKLLGTYIVTKGYVIATMSADQIADLFFTAASDDNIISQLKWLVKPAKLVRNETEGKAPVQKSATASIADFTTKVKKSEAADAYEKTQESARRQITELVDKVLFVDGIKGTIKHGKTEAIKTACKNHVQKAIAGKRDLTVVAKELSAFIQKEFEKDERSREQV